jgi:SAM-dependent methyltransferase
MKLEERGVTRRRADYGIDAPYVPRNLAIGGVAALAVALAALLGLQAHQPVLAIVLQAWGFLTGLSCLATAGLFLWGSKVGKLRMCLRLLDDISWRGDELVLDVGCGRGLLLIEAAKRLTTGKAVGIDLWRAKDLSGNRPDNAWANIQAEEVSERATIVTGDARALPFADSSFDVIVSSSALHNIDDQDQRRRALGEIIRALKAGGHLCIFDIQHTGEYVEVLRASDFSDLKRSGPTFMFGIPAYVVMGRKPTAV